MSKLIFQCEHCPCSEKSVVLHVYDENGEVRGTAHFEVQQAQEWADAIIDIVIDEAHDQEDMLYDLNDELKTIFNRDSDKEERV